MNQSSMMVTFFGVNESINQHLFSLSLSISLYNKNPNGLRLNSFNNPAGFLVEQKKDINLAFALYDCLAGKAKKMIENVWSTTNIEPGEEERTTNFHSWLDTFFDEKKNGGDGHDDEEAKENGEIYENNDDDERRRKKATKTKIKYDIELVI